MAGATWLRRHSSSSRGSSNSCTDASSAHSVVLTMMVGFHRHRHYPEKVEPESPGTAWRKRFGAFGRIRTCDSRFRNSVLYRGRPEKANRYRVFAFSRFGATGYSIPRACGGVGFGVDIGRERDRSGAGLQMGTLGETASIGESGRLLVSGWSQSWARRQHSSCLLPDSPAGHELWVEPGLAPALRALSPRQRNLILQVRNPELRALSGDLPVALLPSLEARGSSAPDGLVAFSCSRGSHASRPPYRWVQ